MKDQESRPKFSMTVSDEFKRKYTNKKLEAIPCPLCLKGRDSFLTAVGFPGVPVRNVICKNCGLIRINPRMSQKDYDDFYVQDFFEYLNPFTRPHYVNTIEKTTDPNFITESEKHQLPYILPYVKEGGKVFDVGAGFGQFLYLLKREKKVKVFGVEPDPGSRKIAQERMGIALSPDTVEEYFQREEHKNEKFDFIILEQVFEHLLQPLETLRLLGNRLNPQGVIYIGVPGMYNYGVAADRFFELAHTYGYTPAVLKKFADMAGLKLISVRDPFSSCLEVMMALKSSNYAEEKETKTKYGKKWYVTRNRILGKMYYLKFRGVVKKILLTFFGERVKNILRSIVDKFLR